MRTVIRFVALAAITLVVVASVPIGCGKTLNAEYCKTHGTDIDCLAAPDASVDAAAACSTDDQCPGAVCDTVKMHCVQCLPSAPGTSTENSKCSLAQAPICDPTYDVCVPCATDGQCTFSPVCLPDGSCATGVLFAAPAGTGDCSSPTSRCDLATALGQIAAGHFVVDLASGTYTAVTLGMKTVHYIVRGEHPTAGAAPTAVFTDTIAVTAGADVELDDLDVSGSVADGIDCTSATLTGHRLFVHGSGGVGVQTTSCAFALDRSLVSNNAVIGVTVSGGTVDLENNMIVQNGNQGDQSSTGAFVQSSGTIRFNTVADNQQKNTGHSPASGLVCDGPITAPSNLVIGNTANQASFTGGCTQGNSLATGTTTGVFATAPSPATWGSYHLASGAPGTILNVPGFTGVGCAGFKDFDGERRPMGGACDLGADELTQP